MTSDVEVVSDLFLIIFRNDKINKLIFKNIKSFNKSLYYIRYNFYDLPIELIIKNQNQSLLKEKLELYIKNKKQQQQQQQKESNEIFNYHLDFKREWFYKLLEWQSLDFEIFITFFKIFKNYINIEVFQKQYYYILISKTSRVDILNYIINQIPNEESNHFIKFINFDLNYDSLILSNEMIEYIQNYKTTTTETETKTETTRNTGINEMLFWKVYRNKYLFNIIFDYLKTINTINVLYYNQFNNNNSNGNNNLPLPQSYILATKLQNVPKGSIISTKSKLDKLLFNSSKSFKVSFYNSLVKRNEIQILESLFSNLNKRQFNYNFIIPLKYRNYNNNNNNTFIKILNSGDNDDGYELSRIFLIHFLINVDFNSFQEFNNSIFMKKLFKYFIKIKITSRIKNQVNYFIDSNLIYNINSSKISDYIINKVILKEQQQQLQIEKLKEILSFSYSCYKTSSIQDIESKENQYLFNNFLNEDLYQSEILNLKLDWLKIYIDKFNFTIFKFIRIVELGFKNIINYIIYNKIIDLNKENIQELIKLLQLSLPSNNNNGNQELFEFILPHINSSDLIENNKNLFFSLINDTTTTTSLPNDPIKRIIYLKNVNRIKNYSNQLIEYNFSKFKILRKEDLDSPYKKLNNLNLIKSIPRLLSSSSKFTIEDNQITIKNMFYYSLKFSNSFKLISKLIKLLNNNNLNFIEITNLLLIDQSTISESYTRNNLLNPNSYPPHNLIFNHDFTFNIKIFLFLFTQCKKFNFNNDDEDEDITHLVSLCKQKNYIILDLILGLNNFKNFDFFKIKSNIQQQQENQQQQRNIKICKFFIKLITDLNFESRDDFNSLINHLSNSNFNINNFIKPELYQLFNSHSTEQLQVFIENSFNYLLYPRSNILKTLFNLDSIFSLNNSENETLLIISNNNKLINFKFK